MPKPPINSVTVQFSKEVKGSYYKNFDGNLYQLRVKPIINNGNEPRILFLQNCDNPHITVEITNRVDWEFVARP